MWYRMTIKEDLGGYTNMGQEFIMLGMYRSWVPLWECRTKRFQMRWRRGHGFA